MCANCFTTADAVLSQAAFAAYVLKNPIHQALAACGLAAEPDPVAHDVRTVAFLESLELDPVEVLGADVVDRASRWVPAPRRQTARFAAGPSRLVPIG